MKEKEKLYEKGSLLHYADIAFKDIKKLSKSQKISDKLIAFNLVLFILILGFDISYWLKANPNEPFGFVILLLISMIFSAIVSIAYGTILTLVSNLTTNKIYALRIGVVILFFDLSLALYGTLFNAQFIVNSSAFIIVGQIIIILILGFTNFSVPVKDKIVKTSQLKEILGTLASFATVLNCIISLITITIKYLK